MISALFHTIPSFEEKERAIRAHIQRGPGFPCVMGRQALNNGGMEVLISSITLFRIGFVFCSLHS